jgi:diguanylate cyclase (GGDEF)-like protein
MADVPAGARAEMRDTLASGEFGSTPRIQRLLERWQPHRPRRLTPRELRVEAVTAVTLVLVAVALPALLPDQRALDAGVAVALVACHAVASRVRLYVGAGFSMPTQLVLVPMLFLLPATTVPLCVACGLVLASLVDEAGGRVHPERTLTSLADAWHSVGPALVVALAGEPAAGVGALPVLVAALGAQCATDLLASTAREWLGRGIPPAAMLRVMGAIYLIDAALTPLGFWAAEASGEHRFAFLGVLPLVALFAALASDRRARIEEAVGRLDELQAEHARLDRAIRRIGEAFASKLDRDALAGLMLRTAVEAVDAEHGRARLATRTIASGEPAGAVLDEAERAARRDGRLWMTCAEGEVAMASPLTSGDDLLVVGRRGAPFTPEEQALFGYLAQQTAAAMENVALHDRLRWQATVDELTGLANHRAFQDSLAAEVTRMGRFPRPLALAILDIDDFKAINDTYGHQQGDVVLRSVAGVLRRACRVTDDPARYGGEELAVILPNTDLDGAFVVAEAIRRAVQALEVRFADGTRVGVTVSVGTSALERPDGDPAALVAAADAALYQAKRAGKNRTRSGGWVGVPQPLQ